VAEPAIGDLRLSSAIAGALDDMCRDLERFQARQEQRALLGRCIDAADDLIEALEGISLAGWPVVPADWQPLLDRFAEQLPPGVRPDELRSGGAPCGLLDQIFEIEERLFQLRLGEWALVFERAEIGPG